MLSLIMYLLSEVGSDIDQLSDFTKQIPIP